MDDTYENLVASTIGAFLEGELADILSKDKKLAEQFWGEYAECDCCGRVWSIDDLDDPEDDEMLDGVLDGLYCFYCLG